VFRAAAKGKAFKGKPGSAGKPGLNRGGNVKTKDAEEDIKIFSGEGMTVTQLADQFGKNPAAIVAFFFAERGLPTNVNSFLDRDMIEMAAVKFGKEILFDDAMESEAANRGVLKEDFSNAEPRPPVVTVMGHVDHGKTTLLDTIRKRSVASGEAGGITQSIGAYTVKVGDALATFIDTPGHEAFTSMRARGAQVTDIAVLVVAADDGVMPQTSEAIAHAKAAGVPIIVAINKIDKKGADPERARQMLVSEDLTCEEYGGDVSMVPVSAKNNIGIEDLLEIIALQADLLGLKAPRNCRAAGVVLEATFDTTFGSTATLLVQKGTLRVGDHLVAGAVTCKVRVMTNEAGGKEPEATPSTAVQVSGFSGTPCAGDQFQVCINEKEANRMAEAKKKSNNATEIIGFSGSVSDVSSQVKLAIILKTETQGAIAAVKTLFEGIKLSDYVNLRWVMTSAGIINESDIELAATCPKDQRCMVLGFNSTITPGAAKLAKVKDVFVKTYKIVYEMYDEVKEALLLQIGKQEDFKEIGKGTILAIFDGKFGKVAGTRVDEGRFVKSTRVRCYRRGRKMGEGNIVSIRQGKNDAEDVREGDECGFTIEGFNEWEVGDDVVCYEVTLLTPEIDKKRKSS